MGFSSEKGMSTTDPRLAQGEGQILHLCPCACQVELQPGSPGKTEGWHSNDLYGAMPPCSALALLLGTMPAKHREKKPTQSRQGVEGGNQLQILPLLGDQYNFRIKRGGYPGVGTGQADGLGPLRGLIIPQWHPAPQTNSFKVTFKKVHSVPKQRLGHRA